MSHQNFILPTSGVGHVVTLLLRGYEVQGDDLHYKKFGGLHERLRNLRPVDSGLYQCVATNSLGTKKATMNLSVQSRPAGLYSARYADLIYHDKTFYLTTSTSPCLDRQLRL